MPGNEKCKNQISYTLDKDTFVQFVLWVQLCTFAFIYLRLSKLVVVTTPVVFLAYPKPVPSSK